MKTYKTIRLPFGSFLRLALAGAIASVSTLLFAQSDLPAGPTPFKPSLQRGVAPLATNAPARLANASNSVVAAYAQHNPATRTNRAALAPGQPGRRSTTRSAPAHRQPAQLVEIGPNHRTWLSASTNFAGIGAQRGQVVELTTGMNYSDGNHWLPSQAIFEATGNGFAAQRVQHKTRLNHNLNTAGAVTTVAPDGTVLSSTPVAIALYDADSGRSAVIASLTDCSALQLSSNQVVYPRAFRGDGISADAVFTIERGTLEQDVIIRSRLNPSDYGFPTNSTRIQIITAFYGAPEPDRIGHALRIEESPQARQRMASPDLMDETLDFGAVTIGLGRAFGAGLDSGRSNPGAPVAKAFIVDTNQAASFLIESVEYSDVRDQLQALPRLGAVSPPRQYYGLEKALASLTLPGRSSTAPAKTAAPGPGKELAANAYGAEPGLTIDYLLTLGGTKTIFTFQGDTTYFISGPLYVQQAIIEGGSVIKYSTDSTATIYIQSSLVCKSGSYRPATFTAGDDDSIGWSLDTSVWPGYTGSIQNPPPYGNPALLVQTMASSGDIKSVHFTYLQEAIRFEMAYPSRTVSDSQFVNCVRAIKLVYGSGSGSGGSCGSTGCPFYVNNCLMAYVQNPFNIYTPGYGIASNCTVDNCGQVVTASSSFASFSFNNSILANCTTLATGGVIMYGTKNGFWQNAFSAFGTSPHTQAAGTSPFQTGDYGAYYLSSDSLFRAKGASSTLIKGKTTSPPISFPAYTIWTGDITLFPQIARYSSGNADLGYYYDVLDYTVAWITSEAANITVLPGTAIGFRNDFDPYNLWYTWIGFDLLAGSTFTSHGMATNQVTFAPAYYVQEGPFDYTGMIAFVPDYWPQATGWENVANTLSYVAGSWPIQMPVTLDGTEPPPVMDFRFTKFFLPAEASHFSSGWDWCWFWEWSPDSAMNLTLQDCALSGGWLNIGAPDDSFLMPADYVYGQASFAFTNNLFDRVQVDLEPAYNWDTYMSTVGVDASLYAYNNLFRGGLLLIAPVQPSTGTWTWMDSLFDSVAFLLDENQSFAWGYDVYWPAKTSQTGQALLTSWQPILQWLFDGSEPPWVPLDGSGNYLTSTTFGPVVGPGDYTLSSAPGYYSGPLGSFYTAAIAHLYNCGSRTPAAAGLYHYTTRTDQTKDARQTAVNIGLHYVATLSSANSVPKDNDSDGIPDYIEDANRDGLWDQGTETDWQHNFTTSGVEDKNNSLFDNIDLDGDGMVGSAERVLSKNPISPDNPLALSQQTDGSSDNLATFLVPISYDLLTTFGLKLRVEGQLATLQRCTPAANGNCLLTWDTTYEFPGQGCAQMELDLTGRAIPGAFGPISLATVAVGQAPYQFPMTPASASWAVSDPYARVDSVLIDPSWLNTATSWQMFSSAIGNPYFRVLWVPGDSISDSYSAAKDIPTLSILAQIESDTDFGINVLRFLRNFDAPTLADGEWSESAPCIADYIIVAHMAGLDSALNGLDQTSLSTLFRIAVWDAHNLVVDDELAPSAIAASLVYSVYPKLSPPPAGVTLPSLTSDQLYALDHGELPMDLVPTISAVYTSLGLSSRLQ